MIQTSPNSNNFIFRARRKAGTAFSQTINACAKTENACAQTGNVFSLPISESSHQKNGHFTIKKWPFSI